MRKALLRRLRATPSPIRRRWWHALGLVAMLGVVGACGGGGDTPPGTGDGIEPAPTGATLFAADVRVNESLDAHAEAPQICAFGDLVYVTWMDARHGGWSIYFDRSTDGGRTWSPSDTRLDHSPVGVPSARWPQMTCCGDRVYVVWTDERNGRADLYFNWSDDGGFTWQSNDVRLDGDVPGAAASYDPEIACTEDFVYVVWEDTRRAVEDVFVSVSHDGGQSWAVSDERLSEAGEDILSGAFNPGVCCEGGQAYVHWSQARGGQRDVLGRWTGAAGTAWDPESMLNTNLPASSWSWISRAVAPGGGLVHAAWHDNRSSGGSGPGEDIYYNRSVDGGRTWQATDVLLPLATAQSAYRPVLCASDQNVFVAWLHSSLFVSHMIRARRSLDGGSTWSAAEEDVVRGPTLPGMIAYYSEIVAVCDPDYVFVAWNDNRASVPTTDAYINYAPWTGPFQSADYRLNSPTAGSTNVQEVDLCTSGGAAFAVWVDDRDGHRAVYVNVLRP